MATLNTLRTKYGIVLSIVIAIVLLAFILGDQLSYRGADQEIVDEVVMTINGDEIKQSEYYPLRESYSQFQQMGEDAVADMTARTLLYNHYVAPALKEAGVVVAPAEIDAYAAEFGQMMANQLKQYGWPDDQIVPMVQNQWAMESLTAEQNLAMEKFAQMLAKGVYVNRLEVEAELRAEALTFDGRYVAVPYSTIANDAIEISEEEVEAYYQANRQENPAYDSRIVRYVRFDIEPSEEDKAALEAEVKALDAKVKELGANTEAVKGAVRTAGGKVGTYKTFASLASAVAEAFEAGNSYGPELANDKWEAHYLLSDVTAPVSYDFEVATFDNMAQAEAVAEELKANGGDFDKLSEAVDVATDSRVLANMTEAQAKNFVNATEGAIFAFSDNGVPAVAKITALGEKQRFVLTADVEKPVVAGEKTIRELNHEVEAFEAAMGEDMESFQAASDAAGRTLAAVTVNRNNYNAQMGRMAGYIPNSRQMALWAYGAEVGEAKRFSIDGAIYVAMIASVDTNKYAPRNDMQIRQALLVDKKYAQIAEQLTSIEAAVEGAEAGTFAGVKFADNTLAEGKGDAKLVGAIASQRETGREVKVKGNTAAYIFVVDAINGDVDLATVETERTPLLTQRENMLMQNGSTILASKAEVEDFRAEGTM